MPAWVVAAAADKLAAGIAVALVVGTVVVGTVVVVAVGLQVACHIPVLRNKDS